MTKLLSKRQVKEIVSLSPAHIDRLEKRGDFPTRIRISVNRVGWIDAEIEEWVQNRIALNRAP